ncbi:MAG: response regulator transcription factor [Chloroflexota bacterium]
MATILLVDDNAEILRIARDVLEHNGFAVLTATTGEGGLRLAGTRHPDLLVLDLGLPDIDGLDVARELRRAGDLPIIMLTARADEADRLIGLELGADDYLVKPFSPRELVARVRAVLRRTDAARAGSRILRAGDLVIDRDAMRVTAGDRRVELTATEFALLAAMARQPGRVFTRAQLLDAIHGEAFEAYERAIDAHIKNIRRKLEVDPRAPRYVETVIGVGYRLSDGAGAAAG